MSGAAGRFQRVMLALPRFAEQETQSLSQLAESLGVAPTLLLADLQSLTDRFDEPAGYQEPVSVAIEGDSVTITATHFLRPMRLCQAELAAIELGLSLLVREAEGEPADKVEELRQRLQLCISRLPRDEVHAGLRDGALAAPGDAQVRALIRRALRQSRVLAISYARPGDASDEQRDVRPFRLCWSNGAWYLVAWCEKVSGLRNFRVDRISGAEILDRTHDGPGGLDDPALAPDGLPFVTASPPPPLVIRYAPSIARWISERDGLPLESDGAAVRTMPLADREWAVRHVLQYGPDCRVLEPEDLRDEILERLRAL